MLGKTLPSTNKVTYMVYLLVIQKYIYKQSKQIYIIHITYHYFKLSHERVILTRFIFQYGDKLYRS